MNKKLSLFFLFFLVLNFGISQNYDESILKFQNEMNSEFSDSSKSPLSKEDRLLFEKLDFFNIDSLYRINAKFVRTPDEVPFSMKTTTKRAPIYVKYAEATFVFNGIDCKLAIYQNLELISKTGYEDYLFLPFTDLTNGAESYGGGRYIDLKVTESDTIIIDFNKAYNPYCAYNHKYSCPIPPAENILNVEIKAGVKAFNK